MSKMRQFKRIILVVLGCYLIACALLYINQDYLIFLPKKVAQNYNYDFKQPYSEINLKTKDNVILNAVYFKAPHSKGVIYYLHGKGGSLKYRGNIASIYTNLGYDLFLIDYRGFGKSEGSITNEAQQYSDLQLGYDFLKSKYDEKRIIVLGYSIGTGMAAYIAAHNKPKMLILQAPYYSLPDLIRHYSSIYPLLYIPSFLVKYQFPTNLFIKQCTMPVIIFHGTKDKTIYYGSSLKLKKLMKSEDKLITLDGAGHNSMTYNKDYQKALKKLLN